ncbi:response regulator transcription factor [Duganella sp. Root336D2]|uniref:response regulator transcription factor n=1 Tax=Duganella sp. Root336D2 TaxID=1736518 RepID=UPI0006F63749|nr:response regulator [Duganella sp. Root336D2]KQV54366.1 LuxR family transcriptional regulator [Duganella sp. Root336D2]
MSTRPWVNLVDDQPEVRKALLRLLAAAGYQARGFASAADFLAAGAPQEAGCIVLDLEMPGIDGLGLQRLLAERASLLPVIFLSGHGDLASGVQAMKAGATDFLTKPVDEAALLAAVQAALQRNQAAHASQASQSDLRQRLDSLTPRERDVLPLLAEGMLNKQIAATLGTAEQTIKIHRARILQKMQVRSVTALVRLLGQA